MVIIIITKLIAVGLTETFTKMRRNAHLYTVNTVKLFYVYNLGKIDSKKKLTVKISYMETV